MVIRFSSRMDRPLSPRVAGSVSDGLIRHPFLSASAFVRRSVRGAGLFLSRTNDIGCLHASFFFAAQFTVGPVKEQSYKRVMVYREMHIFY